MSRQKIFIYAVCGSEKHIKTLHLSLKHLKALTQQQIIVVTDSSRNQMAINHEQIIDVRTPQEFDHHQASIYLKTSLHRLVELEHDYCYLDSDVIAVRDGIDTIFEHQYGPITFARDLTTLESKVSRFSPWAINCSCAGVANTHSCTHLRQAIEDKFGITVSDEWLHWNGGVFLFGQESVEFMDMWHEYTMQIFQDPYWKTRDQGTLIVSAWKFGLHTQRCLPHSYNFIADLYNNNLCFSQKEGYSLHHSTQKIQPYFLHLCSSDLSRDGWNVATDLENVIIKKMGMRKVVTAMESKSYSKWLPFRKSSQSNRPLEVIVAAPYWAMNGVNIFSANLVRGLQASGVSAHILLTEHNSSLVQTDEPFMPLPDDIPIAKLPRKGRESWGAHWRAMMAYLEERAPCIYIPNCDWRHSVVSSKLSDKVAIVGVVHSDDPLHYNHVTRLGRYWNAIVTTSQAITQNVAARHPALSNRLITIPIGVPVADELPKRTRGTSFLGAASHAPLRIIYHGGLNQHQKRILDLPPIIETLLKRQVPVELTVIGDGPERERLHAASQPLVERGAIRFLGVLPHAQILKILEEHDAYILTSEFEGMPNALNEAMGRGCVPVVSDIRSGIPELIDDGVNGYRVPVGNIQLFAERLALLQRDVQRRREMSMNAYRTVVCGGYRTEDMVQRYLELFHHVMKNMKQGTYKRPSGKLHPPPQEVAGIQILPGNYAREIDETERSLSWKGRLLTPAFMLSRFGRQRLGRIRTVLGGA